MYEGKYALQVIFYLLCNAYKNILFCLCWGFTAQSTQWGHVERGQFT